MSIPLSMSSSSSSVDNILLREEEVTPSGDSKEKGSYQALKDRIAAHYDVCSSYYLSMCQHIHHGYWAPDSSPNLTKEEAQEALIRLLIQRAGLKPFSPASSSARPDTNTENASKISAPSISSITSLTSNPDTRNRRFKVLDVGCGVGGTTRFLARAMGYDVIGITISGEQVRLAERLSGEESVTTLGGAGNEKGCKLDEDVHDGKMSIGSLGGTVRFVHLDAEHLLSPPSSLATILEPGSFDLVWISEVLSHLPNKPGFFHSASQLLSKHESDPGNNGKLVIADWFKSPTLTELEHQQDIKIIEDGMLLPPLGTMDEYVAMAENEGMEVRVDGEVMDISQEVAKTWDISLSLIQSPALWAFAFSQGLDFIRFLKSFQAMRRGFKSGSFRYGVVVFEKGKEGMVEVGV